jgi:trehalose 6-phosphate synthase
MDGLVVCSHRGPFTYDDGDGTLRARRGSGGLVTALSGMVYGDADVMWLSCALSEADRQVARGPQPRRQGNLRLTMLDVRPELHSAFYDDACVTGLGFLFHGLVDLAHTPLFDVGFRRGWQAYRDVNLVYANELVKLPPDRPVLVEDYHLMFVASAVRRLRPGRCGPLVYFHHVPWCAPTYFGLLPARIRVEVLEALLAFDGIGFHARTWADEFLSCCAAFLPGVTCHADRVAWRGREVAITVAPAQLDVARTREDLDSADTRRWERRLRRLAGDRRLVVRVDRVDLWKNIPRGFLAFEHLVTALGVDDVAMLAILAPSRTHLPVYRRYLATCVATARRINRRLAPRGRGPIRVVLAGHAERSRALAGLRLADTVLVNSTSDGLNLVAKESVIAGGGRGRLVLSENAGVYEHIGAWTYGIHPFDIEATATATAAALAAQRGPAPLLAAVAGDSPQDWIQRRLAGAGWYAGPAR